MTGRYLDYLRPSPLGHGALGCRGIIRSSVVTMYQLGLVRQPGSVTGPPRASTSQGACYSAMNPARSVGTSAASDAWNLFRSKNRKPSLGGKIGG